MSITFDWVDLFVLAISVRKPNASAASALTASSRPTEDLLQRKALASQYLDAARDLSESIVWPRIHLCEAKRSLRSAWSRAGKIPGFLPPLLKSLSIVAAFYMRHPLMALRLRRERTSYFYKLLGYGFVNDEELAKAWPGIFGKPLSVEVSFDTSEVHEAIDLLPRLPDDIRDGFCSRISDLPDLGIHVGDGEQLPAGCAGNLPLRYVFSVRVLWLDELRAAAAGTAESDRG